MSRREVITLDVKAEVSQVKQAAKDIEQSFSKLNLSQSVQKTLNNSFANLTKNIQDFEVAAEKGFSSIKESDAALKKLSKINDEFIRLKNLGRDLGNDKLSKLLPPETLERYEKLEDLLKRVNSLKSKDNTKAISSTQSDIDKETKNITKLEGKIKSLTDEANKKREINLNLNDNEIKKAKNDIAEITKQMSAMESNNETRTGKYRALSTDLTIAKNSLKQYENQVRTNQVSIQNNEAEISKYNALLESQQSVLSNLKTKMEGLKSGGDNTALTKLREDLANLNNSKLENIPEDIQGITNEIQKAINSSGNLGIVKQSLEKIGMSSKEASTTVEKLAEKNRQVGDTASEFARVGSEVDALKSRLTYFFSVMNGFQLFKRVIRDAITSVKELDKAMTETAVVTKKSVQDLWDEMSSYTKVANELGTTTLGAYQAMTLYYQQGLDNAQATALMTETLKMGRIAGLEAKESTDLMTAALRGFNMELNETSAQRVNDVYSNLAANAAANTQEIADAMTRTASIAHSAGMEFETTAAFLTQMINFATYTRVA